MANKTRGCENKNKKNAWSAWVVWLVGMVNLVRARKKRGANNERTKRTGTFSAWLRMWRKRANKKSVAGLARWHKKAVRVA